MPHYYDLLALGAATCWAASGLLSAEPSKHLGAIAYVRWRMLSVAVLMWVLVYMFSKLPPLAWSSWGIMALSGFIGIFFGDSALFAAMNRLGPRRTGVLFASHALFSALLGYAFLSERLGAQVYVGASLTVIGVMVAIAWGQHKTGGHPWDAAPSTGVGVGLALIAACAQALGALIAKPVMQADVGFDPVLASAIRVTTALLAFGVLYALSPRYSRAHHPLNWTVFRQTLVSGWIGMGLGMGLLLWALREGPVGSVGVLSGLSPVLILPMLWWQFGRAPAIGAWLGAALAVAGTALVIAR